MSTTPQEVEDQKVRQIAKRVQMGVAAVIATAAVCAGFALGAASKGTPEACITAIETADRVILNTSNTVQMIASGNSAGVQMATGQVQQLGVTYRAAKAECVGG